MRLRNRGHPKGLAALTALFLAMMVRRGDRRDLALLKGVLEASTPAPPNPVP